MDYFELIHQHPDLFSNEDALLPLITDREEISSWVDEKRASLKEGQPGEWAEIGVVFDDPYVIGLRDLVEFPGKGPGGYLRLFNRAFINGGAAGVVILPRLDGKFLLEHHYRHATRSWHWEVPRGFGEAGMDAARQAAAEISEEVGGEIEHLEELEQYFNNTGLEGAPAYLFLAEMKLIGNAQAAEGIDELRWVSLAELEDMIASGEINDGFTIAAYTRAKLRGLL